MGFPPVAAGFAQFLQHYWEHWRGWLPHGRAAELSKGLCAGQRWGGDTWGQCAGLVLM